MSYTLHTSIFDKTTTRDEPFPASGAPFHVATLMMKATRCYETDRATIRLIVPIGNPRQIYIIVIRDRILGAGDRP
jgi:hypothetical protein